MVLDIGKFRDLAASNQMGRARIGGDEGMLYDNKTVIAPNRSAMGKLFSRIGDFFSRATTEGKRIQERQNRDVRETFAEELRLAYPRADKGKIDAITQQPTKPLMVRDIKAILSDVELSHMFLTVPPSNDVVKISTSLVPRATLQQVDHLDDELQHKIVRGYNLVNALRNQTIDMPTGAPSKKDVSDIMWYLHVAAENKVGKPFSQGAVTVDDPGGRIRAFLDKNDEVYQRKSSHIGGFQKVDGGAHRGIDFGGEATNLDELLPNGRATVLYGRLAEGTQQMPREMLFVKLESHGCRLASPSSKIRDDGAHGPESRRIRLGHDLKAFFGHAFSFISGIKERASGNHAAGSRKERINAPFIEGYEALLKKMPDPIKEMLKRDDPLSKSGGIRVMSNNIAEVRKALERGLEAQKQQAPQDEPFAKQDLDLLDTLDKMLEDHDESPKKTGYVDEIRPGSTVVFGEDLLVENEFEEVNILDEDVVPKNPKDLEGPVLGPQNGIDRETAMKLGVMLAEFNGKLNIAYGDGDISLRIGNEVILGRDDL